MDATGHSGLHTVAGTRSLFYGALEQPMGCLSICGPWSTRPVLGGLLGDLGVQEKEKLLTPWAVSIFSSLDADCLPKWVKRF